MKSIYFKARVEVNIRSYDIFVNLLN